MKRGPKKDEEREELANLSFKADAETVAALGRVLARRKPVGGSRNSKSTVLRALILEEDARLEATGPSPAEPWSRGSNK